MTAGSDGEIFLLGSAWEVIYTSSYFYCTDYYFDNSVLYKINWIGFLTVVKLPK